MRLLKNSAFFTKHLHESYQSDLTTTLNMQCFQKMLRQTTWPTDACQTIRKIVFTGFAAELLLLSCFHTHSVSGDETLHICCATRRAVIQKKIYLMSHTYFKSNKNLLNFYVFSFEKWDSWPGSNSKKSIVQTKLPAHLISIPSNFYVQDRELFATVQRLC